MTNKKLDNLDMQVTFFCEVGIEKIYLDKKMSIIPIELSVLITTRYGLEIWSIGEWVKSMEDRIPILLVELLRFSKRFILLRHLNFYLTHHKIIIPSKSVEMILFFWLGKESSCSEVILALCPYNFLKLSLSSLRFQSIISVEYIEMEIFSFWLRR